MRSSLLVLVSSLLLAACDSPSGSGSSNPSTGDGAHFFLPTGEATNTTDPRLVVDAQGNTHAVYPRYYKGDAFYAFCGAGCKGQGDATEVVLPTHDTVTGAMITLTAEGHPRVLLADSQQVYYASCDTGCGTSAGWKVSVVVQHDGEKEVTGAGFALDHEGRPAFLLHTKVRYFHIGEREPQTELAVATGDPHEASGWSITHVSDQNWYRPTLRFDQGGHAHVAAIIQGFKQPDGSLADQASYLACQGDCTRPESWSGIGLVEAYASETDAVSIRESVSLALTQDGRPRVLALGRIDDARTIDYFSCDADCTGDHWKGSIISQAAQIGDGIELALDADDHPRFVYTLDYNIGLASCNSEHCEANDAPWNLTMVEASTQIPPDSIFLYENCNVGAWFLHSPSLALTVEGEPRVGYVARDASGGWVQDNPNGPSCPPGTDMLWTRMAVLPPVK